MNFPGSGRSYKVFAERLRVTKVTSEVSVRFRSPS